MRGVVVDILIILNSGTKYINSWSLTIYNFPYLLQKLRGNIVKVLVIPAVGILEYEIRMQNSNHDYRNSDAVASFDWKWF